MNIFEALWRDIFDLVFHTCLLAAFVFVVWASMFGVPSFSKCMVIGFMATVIYRIFKNWGQK